jgi:hypothetical protein
MTDEFGLPRECLNFERVAFVYWDGERAIDRVLYWEIFAHIFSNVRAASASPVGGVLHSCVARYVDSRIREVRR